MVWLEDKVTQWLADDQPSFKSYYGKRPEAHHAWNDREEYTKLVSQ